MLYLFPGAPVTNDHQLGGLKWHKCRHKCPCHSGARSPKSQHWQDRFSLRTPGEDLSVPLSASGCCWQSGRFLAHRCLTPIPASVSLAFSLCVFSPYIQISLLQGQSHEIRTHPNAVWLHWTWLYLHRLFSQIRSHSQAAGFRPEHIFWEGHNSTRTGRKSARVCTEQETVSYFEIRGKTWQGSIFLPDMAVWDVFCGC